MKISSNLKIKNKYFKNAIIGLLILSVLAFILSISNNFINKKTLKNNDNISINNKTDNTLMVFVQDGCIHCRHAEKFLEENSKKYKNVNVIYYNLKDKDSQVLLFEKVDELNISKRRLGTPIFIMNNQYIMGFGEQQVNQLKNLLNNK